MPHAVLGSAPPMPLFAVLPPHTGGCGGHVGPSGDDSGADGHASDLAYGRYAAVSTLGAPYKYAWWAPSSDWVERCSACELVIWSLRVIWGRHAPLTMRVGAPHAGGCPIIRIGGRIRGGAVDRAPTCGTACVLGVRMDVREEAGPSHS